MRQDRKCWYCDCPETVRAIALHHVEKRSLRPDRVDDPENLMPLCWMCHAKTESDQDFYHELQKLWRDKNQTTL